jgi:hypothetical protein
MYAYASISFSRRGASHYLNDKRPESNVFHRQPLAKDDELRFATAREDRLYIPPGCKPRRIR